MSSPTHLPRCLRDACSLWLGNPSSFENSSGTMEASYQQRFSSDEATYDDDGDLRRHHHLISVGDPEAVEVRSSMEGGYDVATSISVDEEELHRDSEEDSKENGPGRREAIGLEGKDPFTVPEDRAAGKQKEDSSTAPKHRDKDKRFAASVRSEGTLGDRDARVVDDIYDDCDDESRKEDSAMSAWRPVILASPSGTSYAGYGPDDVVVVEPPHRGKIDVISSHTAEPSPQSSRSDEVRNSLRGKPAGTKRVRVQPSPDRRTTETDASSWNSESKVCCDNGVREPPLLHELVALALRASREGNNDIRFRRDFQAFLRGHMDHEEGESR